MCWKNFTIWRKKLKILGINKSLNNKAMLYYCLKFRKYTENENPEVVKTKKQKNNAFIKMCSV